jgi:hypothetical protein
LRAPHDGDVSPLGDTAKPVVDSKIRGIEQQPAFGIDTQSAALETERNQLLNTPLLGNEIRPILKEIGPRGKAQWLSERLTPLSPIVISPLPHQ